ncbi:type I restriction enzyme HsdR N-terminal domain-containing protein [Gracilimonas sp. Q87]|uniref:type I restriction enzyme HsdR N-terminal domain-containing protein n=1 Tax=Gracilimonas sp. Q87 TaxID=3384766 RepID=UPI003983E28E
MLSKALGNYPEYRFQNGQKRLWNPIEKKTFADLPEERVRLALVEYLTGDLGFSSSRISFESPVKSQSDKTQSRTDLIYYNKDFKPELLIECKAPSVKLTENASIQIARYNEKINARYLLISNGLVDHWFKNDSDGVKSLAWLPDTYEQKKLRSRDTQYWELRGFIGKGTDQGTKEVLRKFNMYLFGDPVQPIKYLDFDGFPDTYALKHFYRIFGIDKQTKLGINIAANSEGNTRFNVILNVKGLNVAFATAEVGMMKFTEGVVHSGKGEKTIDLNETIDLKRDILLKDRAVDLGKLLNTYS